MALIVRAEVAQGILSGRITCISVPVRTKDRWVPNLHGGIASVRDQRGHIRFAPGQVVAVQPGVGKRAVGRVRITKGL